MPRVNDSLPALSADDSKILANTYHKGISTARILELRKKGLTYAEIGAIVGCTKETVFYHIGKLRDSIDNLKAFKENRADLLSIQQDRLINSLTDADIQKSSAYQKVGMFSLLYDKERLERDKSTSNIANVYSTLDTQHANYRQRIEELEAELGIDDVQDDVQDAEVVQDTPFPT